MAERLFITEFDDTKLPLEYKFSHNLCVRLYDELVTLLLDEKIQRRSNVKINFSDGDRRPKETEKDILKWLRKNGLVDKADEIVSKQLIFAVISDICHFIYQSLDSSRNIRITVAFSLLRKPFLESLLIIEQLFLNEKDFLNRFSDKPEKYDPNGLKNEDKKEIIEKCIEKIATNYALNSDLIYSLRFDRRNKNGIYAVSNSATHLVTTRYSEFKTESNDLNFLFSDYEDWDAQLSYFYYFLPYMLLYMNEIVDEYLLQKKILTLKEFKRRKFQRLIGQLLHTDQFNKKSVKGNSYSNKLTRPLKIKCKSCMKTNQLYKSDLLSLINSNYILCKHCLIDLFGENESLNDIINRMFKRNSRVAKSSLC